MKTQTTISTKPVKKLTLNKTSIRVLNANQPKAAKRIPGPTAVTCIA